MYETKLQSMRPRANANTVVLGILSQIEEQQNNNLCSDSIPIIDILNDFKLNHKSCVGGLLQCFASIFDSVTVYLLAIMRGTVGASVSGS